MGEDFPSTSNRPQFSLKNPPKTGSSAFKRSSVNSHKSSPAKKRRKFPGPAAVLHDIIGFEDTDETVELLLELANEPCDEGEIPPFRDSVWTTVTQNFGFKMLLNYNIYWIEKKLRTNSLHNLKVPFLAAIVSKIEWFQDKIYTVTLTLTDPSGEIKAVILPELFDMFAEEIVVGAAVVLRRFGVLTMGLGKSHYIVITSNNLLAVFTKVNDTVQTCKPHLKQAQMEERNRAEKIVVSAQKRKDCNVGVSKGLGLEGNVFETETFDFDGLDFDEFDFDATNSAVSSTQSNNLQENSVFSQEMSFPVVSQENQNPVVFQEGDGRTNFAVSSTKLNNLQENSVFSQETSLSVISQEMSLPLFSRKYQNTGISAAFKEEDSQMKPPAFSQTEKKTCEAKELSVRDGLKTFRFVANKAPPEAPTVLCSRKPAVSCSLGSLENSQIQQEAFKGIDNNSNSDVENSERKSLSFSRKEEEALEAKKLAVRERLKQFRFLAKEVPPEVPTVEPNPAISFISCSQETLENSQILQEAFEGIDTNSLFDDF